MTVETRKENGVLRIIPDGEMNNLAAPDFEKAYTDCREGVREVLLDLEKVTYITSAGLRVILLIYQEMLDCGGKLAVSHVCPELMDVFTFSGFTGFLTIL